MKPKLIASFKTAFIVFTGITYLIAPIFNEIKIENYKLYILPALIILVFLPFSAEFLHKKVYDFKKPDWKDSPFNMYYPLSVMQFYAWSFLISGSCLISGNYLRFKDLNNIGLLFVFLSISLFVAIYFVLKFNKENQ